GTCWRLRSRRVVERVAEDGTATEELRLSDAEFADISTGCAGGAIGVLGSITAAEINGEPRVIASLGADGALVRQSDGTWQQVRVLSVPPVEASRAESAASTSLLAFGPVLALVVWIVGRRRWPSWQWGAAVTGAGWFTTIMAAGALSFLAGPDTDATRVSGRVAAAGMVVTTVTAIIVARRPPRPRTAMAFPPPRPPPFPPPPPPVPRGGQEGSHPT
ncbi:MAG: hypothetical protein ACRDZN_15860, partial [Acidimicrobiales bacterium]